jgi:hypothetical protein
MNRFIASSVLGIAVGAASLAVPLLALADTTVSVQSVSPSATVAPGTQVSFAVSSAGFTNPVYAIADSFGGSTVSSSNIDSSGNFMWTPTPADSGTHTITVSASDSNGDNATANVTIQVSQNTVPGASGTTSSLSSPQVQAILSLLQSFGADQSVINNVAATLGGTAPVSTAGGSSVTGDGYVFTTFMEEGDSGAQITELQERLAALGLFSVEPTGYFGSVTKAAVVQFQAAHGIDQVGYVGPATRAALNSQ